jgi:SAM-dependent methyltransferase
VVDEHTVIDATRHPPEQWGRYLERFHRERAGITEAILRRAWYDGCDPYQWLAQAVPPGGLVLDIGCGSGPLLAELSGRRRIGLDLAAAELAAAHATEQDVPLLRADASAIPLRDSCIDTVTCSMSLMVALPPARVVAEIVRVLRPGGLLAATLPAGGPLHTTDRALLAGLIAALGAAPAYPAGTALPHIPGLLAEAGLHVISEERRRFAYPLRDVADADLFLDSLYLPGLPAPRYRAARTYLRALARTHRALPIPLRRLTAERPRGEPPGQAGPFTRPNGTR